MDVKRLDDEIKQLHKMPLRPTALAAAIAEIEKEHDELLAKATGKREMRDSRARKLLGNMPEIVRAYRQQLQQAMKVMADLRLVHDARGRETKFRLHPFLKTALLTSIARPDLPAISAALNCGVRRGSECPWWRSEPGLAEEAGRSATAHRVAGESR